MSPQGRALLNTPRLTSLPQRRPTKSVHSMRWVGRRASTLWSWEERGRRIDFFTIELLISAGCFCQAPSLLHPTVKFAKTWLWWGFFQSKLFLKCPHRFTVGFHLVNTDYFWNSSKQIYCTHAQIRENDICLRGHFHRSGLASVIIKQHKDEASLKRFGTGSGATFQSWSLLCGIPLNGIMSVLEPRAKLEEDVPAELSHRSW